MEYIKSWVECPYCNKAQRIFPKEFTEQIACIKCKERFIAEEGYDDYHIEKYEDRVLELL